MQLKYSENFRTCQITWDHIETPELSFSGENLPQSVLKVGGIEDGQGGLLSVSNGLTLRPTDISILGQGRTMETGFAVFAPSAVSRQPSAVGAFRDGTVNLAIYNLLNDVSVIVEDMDVQLTPSAEATVHWKPSAGRVADMSSAPDLFWTIQMTPDSHAHFRVAGDETYFSTADVVNGIASKFGVVPSDLELLHGDDPGNPSILNYTYEGSGGQVERVDIEEGELLLRDLASPVHELTQHPFSKDTGKGFGSL